jgi:adenylate cyclase
MPPNSSTRDRRTARLGLWLGLALVVGVGLLLLRPLGDGLARLSYDLPFLWSNREVPDELVMVYLDPKVKTNLGEPADVPLPRRYYTQLLDKLTADGARLVLFDLIFDSPAADPQTDEAFAAAMKRQGRVVLVGYTVKQFGENTFTIASVPPVDLLANAAVAWGTAEITPDAADQRVRRLETGSEDSPSLSRAAANVINPSLAARPLERWLNYYCEPTQLAAVTLDQVLLENGLKPGFFRDKIVVVGARPGSGGLAGAEREEFPTPYSRFGGPNSSGPAIHALSLLNLLRGDSLMRSSSRQEVIIVLVWGIAVVVVFSRLRPLIAMVVAPIAFTAFMLGATWMQARYGTWFNWLVPAAAQTSVALLWSVGFQYGVEARRRRKLRGAFASYLSPYMADQIANSEFDLSLGGKEVEATIMFTDLEGFTNMSETLPPAEVSRILTSYFNQTTRAILEQDGTIIKYMGDAVFAAWGTPMPEPRHAERAVLAAWGMFQSGQKEIAGRTLRTRIGINSGMVLAGNLGSDFRFDFAAIGNTTNTAARLETLNKYFGTNLLIGDSTKAQLSNRIRTRLLGRFLLAGKSQPVIVHEVLGVDLPAKEEFPWVATFHAAMRNYTERKLDEAEQLFEEAIKLRGGSDGPAEFYLKQIAAARLNLPDVASWDGVVVIASK